MQSPLISNDPFGQDPFALNWSLLASAAASFTPREQKTLLKKIESIAAGILGDVPPEVSRPLEFQVNYYTPSDAVHREDLFLHFSKTLILRGRDDLGGFKMYGGITVPGSPWFDFSFKLFDRCGITTEVHALEGQDGDWYRYRDSTNEKWVRQILDLTRPDDVVFALSTSGNAFIQAWARKPGFCRAVVGVGWPLFLRNAANQDLMERVRSLASPITYFRKTNILKFASTRYPINDLRSYRCPQFTRMPVSVAVELRKSQVKAREALLKSDPAKDNFPPFLYIQGKNDAPVSPLVRDFLANGMIRSPLKHVPELYPNAPHTLQAIKGSQGRMLEDTGRFLRQLYRFLGFKEVDIPAFDKPIGAVAELKRQGIPFFH